MITCPSHVMVTDSGGKLVLGVLLKDSYDTLRVSIEGAGYKISSEVDISSLKPGKYYWLVVDLDYPGSSLCTVDFLEASPYSQETISNECRDVTGLLKVCSDMTTTILLAGGFVSGFVRATIQGGKCIGVLLSKKAVICSGSIPVVLYYYSLPSECCVPCTVYVDLVKDTSVAESFSCSSKLCIVSMKNVSSGIVVVEPPEYPTIIPSTSMAVSLARVTASGIGCGGMEV